MTFVERIKEMLKLERQIARAEERLEILKKHREEILQSLQNKETGP